MQKLKSRDNIAIWLNHEVLINESYEIACSPNADTIFSIKSALFDFRSRIKNESMDHCDKKGKRKRKDRHQTINYSEQSLLKSTIDQFLSILKTTRKFENSAAEDIERVWEDAQCFPKLKGANNTLEFHLFSYNNLQYIIPPQSRFFNHDVTKLDEILSHLETYDFIVLDPPWRNKYIRRIKRAKTSLGYEMLDTATIRDIPLQSLIHENSLVAVWCTNSEQQKKYLTEQLLPTWNLKLLHSLIWIKINTSFELIGELREIGMGKQPYEMLFIACHKDNQRDFNQIRQISFIISIPSIIHSHKPPLLEIFQEFLPQNTRCLELFARYLQPKFTSIGLEVLKLMDSRLYKTR